MQAIAGSTNSYMQSVEEINLQLQFDFLKQQELNEKGKKNGN